MMGMSESVSISDRITAWKSKYQCPFPWPLPERHESDGWTCPSDTVRCSSRSHDGLQLHGKIKYEKVCGGHGVEQVSQIDQPGTYWYHSHTRAQYPDGFRGQFIVHDPENPSISKFDVEVPLTISDWYHDQMPFLMKEFVSYRNPTGAEPVPNSAVMNDTQNLTIPVSPGMTYLFRVANIGAFASQYFWIEGHKMTIVEVDGVYTEPAEADMIYLGVAQRYAFLVTALNSTAANFPITSSMDTVSEPYCGAVGQLAMLRCA